MNKKSSCLYCANLRPLGLHLQELALLCEYLGNSEPSPDGKSYRVARTQTISDWLKLTAQLDEVKVNSWMFEYDAFYCGDAADRVSSDSVHFSLYATALTRFVFVTHALEETYRFVEKHYKPLAAYKCIPESKRPKRNSLKASELIDSIPNEFYPEYLEHYAINYKLLLTRYLQTHSSELSGMSLANEALPSYALHLVRNIRNHVAHGIFPLIPNPDYILNSDFDRNYLLQLLNASCRISALYIQALLGKYNSGFCSDEYQAIEGAIGPEYEYFLANCNIEYLRILHLNSTFSLVDGFNYDK